MDFKEWFYLSEDANNIQSIVRQLPSFYAGSIPDQLMSNIVYGVLADHGQRQQDIRGLLQDPQKYQQYNGAYKELLTKLDAALSSIGWKSENSGAWIEWFRNGNRQGVKTNGQTSKRYISIRSEDVWDVLQSLTVLAKNLNSVKTDLQSDVIGFKIGTNFGSFYQHKDQIVIHFYDAQAQPQIEAAVRNFFSQIGKQEDNRAAMGRTNYGKDANGTSDSMLIAQQVVRNLRANQQKLQQLMQTNPARLGQVIQELIAYLAHSASHRIA